MSRKQNCYDCLIDLFGIACAFFMLLQCPWALSNCAPPPASDSSLSSLLSCYRDTLWRWRYRVVGGDHHHHHHQQALMLGPQHLGDIRWQVPPPILLYPLHLRGWRSLVQSVALSCGRKPQLTTEVLTIPSEWLNSSSVVEGSSLYHDL